MNSLAKVKTTRELRRQLIYVIVFDILQKEDPENAVRRYHTPGITDEYYQKEAKLIANDMSWWAMDIGYRLSDVNNLVSLVMHSSFYSPTIRVDYKLFRPLSNLIYQKIKALRHDYRAAKGLKKR